jgi:hypothetical protein
MERDALEKVISKETNNFSPNYRCHEGARIIAEKLKSLGMDVIVRDGGAIYDTSYFSKDIEDFLPASVSEDLSEEEKEGLAQELKGEEVKSKISIFHSWCEVREDSGNIIVIDWHACLKLSPGCGIENSLIIDSKNNLPHTYVPMGIAIGKLIILKMFPPYAIKLRM